MREPWSMGTAGPRRDQEEAQDLGVQDAFGGHAQDNHMGVGVLSTETPECRGHLSTAHSQRAVGVPASRENGGRVLVPHPQTTLPTLGLYDLDLRLVPNLFTWVTWAEPLFRLGVAPHALPM